MNETRRARTVAGVVVIAALMAACARAGAPGGRSRSGDIGHPTSSTRVILRVETAGGFAPIDASIRGIPEFSLMGDGRLITTGPQTEIYPGPALPSLIESKVDEEGIQVILRAAETAGLLGPDRRFTDMAIADAPTTTFSVDADGRSHLVSAYALGLGQPGAGADEEALRRLSAFRARLSDLSSWLPPGSISSEGPYRYGAVRVFVRPYDARTADIEEPPVLWPIDPPLARFGASVQGPVSSRCGVVDGRDLEALRPTLESSNELTPWRSGDGEYALILRPLLPDERGCTVSGRSSAPA